MFDRILFPTDGSEGAEQVLDHVLDLAGAHDATLCVLHVADTTRDSVVRIQGEIVDVLEREGNDIVSAVEERAAQRRVDTVTDVIQGQPYATIVEYASARDVDLIVMPTHGRRGLERLLLGSTTERVVRRADVPVLTVQPGEGVELTHPYEEILVPTDGSGCAREALAIGRDIASQEDAAMHLLNVIVIAGLGDDVTGVETAVLEDQASELLEAASEFAREAGIAPVTTSIEYGSSVHESILDVIGERDSSLVAVGTHGRTGFDRYLLGSVAESLIRTSPIPVLTVREPENGA